MSHFHPFPTSRHVIAHGAGLFQSLSCGSLNSAEKGWETGKPTGRCGKPTICREFLPSGSHGFSTSTVSLLVYPRVMLFLEFRKGHKYSQKLAIKRDWESAIWLNCMRNDCALRTTVGKRRTAAICVSLPTKWGGVAGWFLDLGFPPFHKEVPHQHHRLSDTVGCRRPCPALGALRGKAASARPILTVSLANADNDALW